jgi:hypothetical protein
MSETESEKIEREIDESWRDRNMGVIVRREIWRRLGEEKTKLVVFATRERRYNSFDGEPTTTEEEIKIAELSETEATEVLHGLAEAHGYELQPK